MNNVVKMEIDSPDYMKEFLEHQNTLRRALGIKSMARTPKQVLEFIDQLAAFATPLYPVESDATQAHSDRCLGACVRRFLEDNKV